MLLGNVHVQMLVDPEVTEEVLEPVSRSYDLGTAIHCATTDGLAQHSVYAVLYWSLSKHFNILSLKGKLILKTF